MKIAFLLILLPFLLVLIIECQGTLLLISENSIMTIKSADGFMFLFSFGFVPFR